MKRILSLLLIALLLCAPLSVASAKTVTDSVTFTNFPFNKTPNYTAEMGPFVLSANLTQEGYIAVGCRTSPMSIVSKDGSIIDRIEFTCFWEDDLEYLDEIQFDHGTKVPGEGLTVYLNDVNATSVNSTGGQHIYVTSVIVYYHNDIPETGDAATPALWLTLGIAAAAALIVLTARRRREF